MHPSIIAGLNGAIYKKFSNSNLLAWNQKLMGLSPYHYMIAGHQFNILPRPPGEQMNFSYLGPNVPPTFRR
ncbi:hypothetical protein [Niallia taxi]|uniref:hypothetical protein n=1 Tax=Niallia taxi TaxID=2499688 RepID=UPI0015F4453F|nr:hypothetical protein [Niallia taxi]